MSVEWCWYDAQYRIMLFTFIKPWTPQEFDDANAEASKEARRHPHVIDVIYDVSQISIAPRNSIANTVNMLSLDSWQPYRGVAITVGAGPSVRMILHVAMQILPKGTLYLAKDMAHALSIIDTLRAKRSDSD